jgi:hypothetical protein
MCVKPDDCKHDIKLAKSENDKIEATLKYYKARFVNREQQDQAAVHYFSTNGRHYTFEFSQHVKLPQYAHAIMIL